MRTTPRRSRAVVCLTLGTLAWTGCSDSTTAPQARTAPPARPQLMAARAEEVRAAIAAQERHNAALFRIRGVVGTAVGPLPGGQIGVQVFVTAGDAQGIPAVLDGVPVAVKVTGQFVASSDPTTRQRPAPIGFSVGHPAITAGTMGALVRDATSQLFVLSNNHVLANQNDASIGDPMLQPGPVDGGTSSDQIGTLAAFQPIDFAGGTNTIDAAIARVTNAADVSNSTPTDDGYGVPGSTIFGDANADGAFDDRNALLGVGVQKYGRTTKLTKGQVTGINATITVCYEVVFIFCVKSATFVDQILIDVPGFSGGGDSGSLIVTDDANRNPVGLLFAGSETSTIANRIDLVLGRFDVAVDGGATTPPPPPGDAGMHVGDLDGASTNNGSTWTATVTVTVHGASHEALSGATVAGSWSPNGPGSNSCTTGSGGTCVVTLSGTRKKTGSVTFTVANVTAAGQTYQASANHDSDGSSDGSSISVSKP